MKILHTVEFYDPLTGGAEEVVKQLSERLAARGHEVTVATSAHHGRSFSRLHGVEVRGFAVSGNAVKGIRGDATSYQQFLLESDFDVVFNYAAQTWTTDLALPVLPRIRGAKLIAPLGYSRLHSPAYTSYFRDLPSSLSLYDRIVYTSPDYADKRFGDEHGLGPKAVIIPNGASWEEFMMPRGKFKERYGIPTRWMFLTVSNHYFAKGHRFVIDAFRRAKAQDCTLVIIGERPARHGWYSCYPLCRAIELTRNDVRVLSGVPRADVVSAYQEADLFLFGSSVECAPLVMYESFASRTPFITTPVGNVRDHGSFIRIVNSPAEMSREIERFLASPSELQKLSEEALRVFTAHHTWEHLAKKFEDLYAELSGASVRHEQASRGI